jgi:DNA polymerase III delta subunit
MVGMTKKLQSSGYLWTIIPSSHLQNGINIKIQHNRNTPSGQFSKKIKIGIDSPLHHSLNNEVVLASKFFIAGNDAFSVSKRGTEIIQSLQDTEIEIIDSNANHVAEVVRELQCVCEALRTISFYATPKWVWYRHVTFLGDSSLNHSEDVLNGIGTLQYLLETIPDVGFLLTAGTVDKRLKLIKWFLENCHGEIFEAPKKAECERYVLDTVRGESRNITPQALHQLLQYTPNDLMEIDQELQKLLLYTADQGTIDVQDVDSIVVDRKGSDFFEMIDSFFGDDDRQFSRNIRCYFRDQNEGRSLLAALQNRMRLFMALGYFHENDSITHIDKSTLERLKAKYADIWKEGSKFAQNPWFLGKLLATAKRCSLVNWIQLQVWLLEKILELSRNPNQQQWPFERLYFQLKLAMHPP